MRRAIVRQGYRPVQGFLIGEGVMRRATTRVQASTEYLNRYQVGVMRRATRVQASTAVAFLGQSVSDWRGFSSQPLSATTQYHWNPVRVLRYYSLYIYLGEWLMVLLIGLSEQVLSKAVCG